MERTETIERNPNEERDRGRAPGHPSIDRVDDSGELHGGSGDEQGRDRPPDDADRDERDPWMGGG